MSIINKDWIDLVSRTSDEYINGVEKFIDFAFSNRPPGTKNIACPCKNCSNRYYRDRLTVREHCIVVGFEKWYKNWTFHGEEYVNLQHVPNQNTDSDSIYTMDIRNNMRQLVEDGFGIPTIDEEPLEIDEVVQSDEATTTFLKLLKDAETELWEGCQEFTTLSFIVELMHLKAISRWSNKSFTELLKILKRALPKSTKLPSSCNEAYKMTADLGFSYKTWDACVNHCMLFRNETENLNKCEICGASRYKHMDGDNSNIASKASKIPAKKMWYFPLKPRLQRLYWSSKTASLMRWHSEQRVDDGVLRHPADSNAWKHFNKTFPDFAVEPRNIRLGLASDEFNPYRNMSSSHSTWPVVLIPYNLPPWLCMKQSSFILSVLTQGPKGPGNKIDVYLQPLIEELKELWENGVHTYDAYKNEMFTLHASLMWTINDFPAYGILSGWSTKGEFACPTCNKRPQAQWLKNSGKWSYIGHRRFLKNNHPFRKDKRSFDGNWEVRVKPNIPSGEEIRQQVEGIETEYKIEDVLGKRKREQKEKHQAKLERRKLSKTPHNWKKKSIFFELPYWQHNLVRHVLDVMHIEKNVCDNLLCTLLNTSKSKDNLKSRLDLKELNIRKPLHPQPLESRKSILPAAQFTMDKKQKDTFLNVLKQIKVPDGYSSNISRCVHLSERTVWGLKSHDSHILLQQLLPIAVRRTLPTVVVKAIIELANFFRQLCSKTNTVADLKGIQDRIPIILCYLEKIFPPSFFDVMEHLPVHLADEALNCSAVHFRWMYPIERYLLSLKLYVRNRTYPEASIAKAYIAEECMTFCARYLEDVETKNNRPGRNDDVGDDIGRCMGKITEFTLDYLTRTQAHRYVLFNTEAVEPYLEQHLSYLKRIIPRNQAHRIQAEHNEKFDSWFRDYVRTKKDNLSEDIKLLALGPHMDARRYKGYIINGFRFRIKDVDSRRKSQNSGVMLNASVPCFASRKDNNPVVGDVNFYGELIDIIEIRYSNLMKFVLFKCNWIDNRTGMIKDEFKFTLVNFKHRLYKENRVIDEPFILATQAKQVWYIQDPTETDWHVVMQMTARDNFDVYSTENSPSSTNVPQIVPFNIQEFDDNQTYAESSWVREGIEGIEVDVNSHAQNDVIPDNDEE